MGTYFSEPQKKQRWESGQAILHRESSEPQKTKHRRMPGETKKSEPETIKNSYGKLNYLHQEKKRKQQTHGFSLEALEAPGTPLHTEKEKHLNPASMKKIKKDGKQTLFASEVPLRSQALFYDMTDSTKSVRFLKYMKHLLNTQGHQTLQDAFGFLDQESEQQELKFLKNTSEELSLEESRKKNQRIDTLNSRLQRKQSKERQLCKDLQLLLDQRAEEERAGGRSQSKAAIAVPEGKEKKRDEHFPKRHFYSASEDTAASSEIPPAEPETPPEEQNPQ